MFKEYVPWDLQKENRSTGLKITVQVSVSTLYHNNLIHSGIVERPNDLGLFWTRNLYSGGTSVAVTKSCLVLEETGAIGTYPDSDWLPCRDWAASKQWLNHIIILALLLEIN